MRDLLVDLAGVHMVDSTGIGLLIPAHNSMQKVSGRITIIHAYPELLEPLCECREHLATIEKDLRAEQRDIANNWANACSERPRHYRVRQRLSISSRGYLPLPHCEGLRNVCLGSATPAGGSTGYRV